MHLVVVLGALRRVLAASLVRIEALAGRLDVDRVAHAVTGVLAFIYADFAGGSGSALRAAWMSAVVLLARAFERRPCPRRALSASVLAMALLDPLAVLDVSLLLSALATSGLLLSGSNGQRHYLLASLRATAAATLPCAPLLAKMAGNLSLGAFAANLVAVPIGEAITLPACLIEPLATGVPWLQQSVITVASGGLRAVLMVASKVNTIDLLKVGVPPPSATENSLLVAGAILALGLPRRARAAAAAACVSVLCVELSLRREAASSGRLSMIALDVGQGDATLVHFPDGQWGLVDAGGLIGPGIDVGARVIASALRELRISELALVVLSHPHPDHFGGFRSGLAGVAVRQVWDTGQGEREGISGEYAAWLSRMREAGVPVARPAAICGRTELHGATVEVLMPCPSSDSTRTPNDNSFMINIGYKHRNFLLVGDAEREEESLALATLGRGLRADVLKVGHHGSRTSTSEAFVRAVGPSIAWVSSGVRNRFGHPHRDTLETLAREGVTLMRTDRLGAITMVTDGASLQVSSKTRRGL
jgi:competence protein ComEC